eukprot:RCo022906
MHRDRKREGGGDSGEGGGVLPKVEMRHEYKRQIRGWGRSSGVCVWGGVEYADRRPSFRSVRASLASRGRRVEQERRGIEGKGRSTDHPIGITPAEATQRFACAPFIRPRPFADRELPQQSVPQVHAPKSLVGWNASSSPSIIERVCGVAVVRKVGLKKQVRKKKKQAKTLPNPSVISDSKHVSHHCKQRWERARARAPARRRRTSLCYNIFKRKERGQRTLTEEHGGWLKSPLVSGGHKPRTESHFRSPEHSCHRSPPHRQSHRKIHRQHTKQEYIHTTKKKKPRKREYFSKCPKESRENPPVSQVYLWCRGRDARREPRVGVRMGVGVR